MGIKKFFQELKTKVSPSRLFKAMIIDSQQVLPNIASSIKSVEIVQGNAIAAGCVVKTTFDDGAPFKYMSSRIEAIDQTNCVCKYALIDGDVLGDKLEKICYEIKIEASEDGGSVIKIDKEYHTKGDADVTEEEVKFGTEQVQGLYKACEDYLIANPHVCA